ncbi:hypothetical protein QTG54_010050 [Skeletonema marinoi]|uniref:Uncharacterized protein n=1 Tax=Skeletonema marinoi TaxID=267567 RepID=A0AAD8Y5P7_9STRA|nr:hypothetical protein QTG54_010050 [Skeletonema marinoi]
MKTVHPILSSLHLFTAARHYQPALSFQPPMSPLHKDYKDSMPQKDDRVAPQASTIVDLSDQCDISDQCWNIDCGSEDYVSHFVEERNENDVFWSIFSNAFFLGGGLFYIAGSSWDVNLSNSESDPQNMFLYYSVWVLGPFVYLLNSSIDVIWAIRTMQADKKQRGLKRFFITAHEHAANVGCEGDTGRDILLALEKFDKHATSLDEQLIEGARLSGKQGDKMRSNVMSNLRRHFGHRRELSSASTFGAAAIFGTASAIGWAAGTMDEDMVNRLELVSIHLYLLSAAFALIGRRQENTVHFTGFWDFFEDAQALENAGDSLFGIASVIDVVLTDFSFDDDNPWWAVVSAVLWMLDAMFYLRGDFVVLYRKQKHGNETNVEMKGTVV